jgi:hypothetical protein
MNLTTIVEYCGPPQYPLSNRATRDGAASRDAPITASPLVRSAARAKIEFSFLNANLMVPAGRPHAYA